MEPQIAPPFSGPTSLLPLTRKNRRGEIYERPPGVEAQIRGALSDGLDRLLERAEMRDHQAPGYLSEECLVYLIQHHRREGREDAVGELSRIMVRRCGKKINGFLQSLEDERRQEAYRDVMAALFERILDVESDSGDFLQVRFWVVVEKLSITAFNRSVREAQRAEQMLRLADLAGEEPDGEEDDETSQRSVVREGVMAPGLSPEEWALLQAALGTVEEPFRTAFVLYHGEGWQLDSKDPDEPTLSKYFGKSERTIRNWLRRVERMLEKWKEQGS